MDLKSNRNGPVLTDTVAVSKSRLGLPSNLAPYSMSVSVYPPCLHVTVPRRKSTTPGKLDEVRCNGWFDIMISSSPPCIKLNKDLTADTALDEASVAYREWMIDHPSALSSFERLIKYAECKKVVLFLDYDGTLSPIVDNPEFAIMSNMMRAAVKQAAKYFPTAIISGRSCDKVFEFVKLRELYYAGSHGMDIISPVGDSPFIDDHPDCIRTTNEQSKEVHLFQPAREFLLLIDEVFVSLIKITKDVEGVVVENNKFCVSVHYRNVDQKLWDEVGDLVHEFVKAYPRLKVTYGRKVFEVRPVIDWNKGKAVEFLLESLGYSNCDDVLSIYVGDDRTDEDAFKVLKETKLGFGILVSTAPKRTNALFSLRDPPEVMEFLKSLVEWRISLVSENESCEINHL